RCVVLTVCVVQAATTSSGAMRNSFAWRRENTAAAPIGATARTPGRPFMRCVDEMRWRRPGRAARPGRAGSALLCLQLLLDQRLEAVEGTILRDLAVDVERRRAADVDGLTERELRVDLLLHGVGVHVGLPLGDVEADLLRDALHGLGREVALILVEL